MRRTTIVVSCDCALVPTRTACHQWPWPSFMQVRSKWPTLDKLRLDPRFQALRRRIGL